jgi:hypothetical protein
MMVLLAAALPGCALMGGGTESPSAAETRQSQDPYAAGKAYFAQKQYGLALAEFRQSLRQHPRAPRDLNAVAACYDQMLRFDLADRYYDLALSIERNSVETLNNVGYSHYRRSQEGHGVEYLVTAQAYLARASALAGKNPVVTANLDMVSAAMAESGDAKADVALSIPGIHVAALDPYASWIERTSPTSVLVVTRPDPATTALTRSLGVLPRIAAITAKADVNVPPDIELSHPAAADGRAVAPGIPAACQSALCASSQRPLGPYPRNGNPIAGGPPADGHAELDALQGSSGEIARGVVAADGQQQRSQVTGTWPRIWLSADRP